MTDVALAAKPTSAFPHASGPRRLHIAVYSPTGEEAPSHTTLAITPAFVQRIAELSKLCATHSLTCVELLSYQLGGSTPEWHGSMSDIDREMMSSRLVVDEQEFWFESYLAFQSARAQSYPVKIADLIRATAAHSGPEELFFGQEPDALRSLVNLQDSDIDEHCMAPAP